MKFALSALALSALFCAPSQAQSAPDAPPPPPPPGMHHDGPRDHGGFGPGMFAHGMPGPGMRGWGAETIPNSPFSAKFTATTNDTARGGNQVQRSSTSLLYRDSQGRVRQEATVQPPPPRPPSASETGTVPPAPATPRGPRTLVVILDPVAHTVTRLNEERKTAVVETVPEDFFTRMQKREEKREASQGFRGDNAARTDLGNRVIGGVSAKGERITHTVPAREGETARSIVSEIWFSPDAKLEVSSTLTTDRIAHTNVLTSFSKAEPDAALFKVPADYTTRTAPERAWRGRHGGPGHDGPPGGGADNAPPPPPSM